MTDTDTETAPAPTGFPHTLARQGTVVARFSDWEEAYTTAAVMSKAVLWEYTATNGATDQVLVYKKGQIKSNSFT